MTRMRAFCRMHTSSSHSVLDTLRRLEGLLESKGLTIFARVDHSGEAAKIGMQMRPTHLLIFGSPKGGTPLMQAAPTVAIDLPLKALVWEDEHDKVLSRTTALNICSSATALPRNSSGILRAQPH